MVRERTHVDVLLLAVCQALFMTCTSAMIATSALVGFALAPHPGLATLPIGAQFLASMLCTMPASFYMKRVGRRLGFVTGALLGMAGAAVASAAILLHHFELFALGAALLGAFAGFSQYYRFAAADVATPAFRPKAISWVMAGGLVAAFCGPNLAVWTQNWIRPGSFAGAYVAMVGLTLLTVAVLAFVRLPPPGNEERTGPERSLVVVASQRRYLVAVFGAMIGYGVMNLVMTSTPLAMNSRSLPFGDTALVIQWHVVGMFAPSFFTGHLIRRFGVLTVMGSGALLQLACAVVHLSGSTVGHFVAGLVLVGVGWNFLFIGATSLLTETYAPAEKAKAQGLNDLLVFATVTLSATSSGFLHARLGWESLNLTVLPLVLAVLLAVLWLALTSSRRPAAA